MNGVASTSATSNTVNLAVGSNVITVSCTNANGTSSDTTTVVRGSVPVVTITSPSTNPFFTTATSINVAFVVNGGTTIPAGTTCAINGVPTTNTTTNNVALPSGPFTITVTCTNQFGSGSASVTKAIPTTPVVTIVSPAADPSSTGNPSINVAFTVNGSTTIPAGTMCSVNGVATTSTTTNSVSLVIGTNTILVTCTNSFGSGSDATTVVRSDSPPNFQITAPVNDSWTAAAQTNVAFTLSGSPSVPAGTTCTVNGTPTTSTTTNSVNLVEGVNTITVVCTNAWGTVSHTVTVNRDSVAPTISPLSLLSHGDPGSFLLQYTASDNSGFAPNCTPASGSIVTIHAGANTITVTCEDRAQNAATSTITFTSTSAFSVSITSGPPEEVYTPVVQFSYAASEQLSSPTPCADPTQPCVQVIVPRVRLDCSLDGGSWFSCPISTQYGGSYTTPSLMPGTHTFCVRGTRLADNAVDQDCSVFTVRGDPPPPSCSHSGSTVTCTLPSVPGTSYTCQLDGEAASNCSGTWIRSGIPSGAHQVRICATNASGSACSIYAFTVDNAQLTITSPVNGSSTTATGVTLTYTTTGFPAGTTCSPASGTRVPVSLGANTISVACTLPSGEVTAPASTSVTRTPLPGFTPTFEHSYDTNDVTGGIVLDFTIANPAGSNPVKTATITHPNEVWPNFNAYGSSASKCDGTIFLTPAPPRFVKHPSCPDVAKVGTVTLSSPDFPSDLHGEIWIVNRGGLPWFGVDFSSASLGNPSSVPTPNMVIQHSSVDDLECDSDIDPSCMSLTQLTVTGFPDATALSAQFHLGSHQDRIDPNGQLLPSEMFRWEVLACDTAYTRATLGSVNNETATVNGPIFLPPSC